MTDDLRALLKAQQAEHERLKKAGHIFPKVFFREVADERGGAKHPKAITCFNKAWKIACRAAGCPVASRTTCGERPSGISCGRASPSAWR